MVMWELMEMSVRRAGCCRELCRIKCTQCDGDGNM